MELDVECCWLRPGNVAAQRIQHRVNNSSVKSCSHYGDNFITTPLLAVVAVTEVAVVLSLDDEEVVGADAWRLCSESELHVEVIMVT
jgi:hypothetical protein